jgi:fumarate reductase subunit D
MSADDYKHWLVRRSTIRGLWMVGIVILAIVTLADFLVHGHPHFGIDGIFGFYSFYGLASCAAMVVGAKGLGYLLKRKDTYYDD